MVQQVDESAIDYLKRILSSLAYEDATILQALPTPQAIIEYFELFNEYDTEYWSGILEEIAGGANTKVVRAFVEKYKLKDLENDIEKAVEETL